MKLKNLLLLILLVVLAVLVVAPALAQGPPQSPFDWIVAKKLTVTTGGTELQSDVDVTGTLNFGSDSLYPLGYASSGYQMVCGSTGTFTGATTITPSGLSAVTYVLLTQITAPITTAAHLHTSAPTTTTVTVTSLNSTFGAGTTGVNAFYCAVGNQ